MTFNNTTLAIVGIIIIGILSTYMGNNELAAVALGGIVGWISRSYSNSGGIVNDQDVSQVRDLHDKYCKQESRISKLEASDQFQNKS